MGQCSPHVHFSSTDLLFCGLGKTTAWGIAATMGGTSAFSVGGCIGGIGQSDLALNRFMEAGTVLGQGVSSLTWKTGALGEASSCGGLQLGAEEFSSAWGLPVGWGIPSNFPCAKFYTVIGMVVATDFTMGIWVDEVKVVTVVGTVGFGFTGTIVAGVVAKGWAITFTLHLLFKELWFSSSLPFWILGFFLLRNCCFRKECWCMVAIGIGVGSWVWGQACPPTLGMSSSFRLEKDRDGALCSRDGMI